MSKSFMMGYTHTTVVKLDTGMVARNEWGGSTSEIGVGIYPNSSMEALGSAYIVMTASKETYMMRYMTPEAALELAFALFGLVEKTKPSLVQNDKPKS